MKAEHLLQNYGACSPSKLYASGKTKRNAWFSCTDARWLIWLVTQVFGVKRALHVGLELVKIYFLRSADDRLKTAIRYVEEQLSGAATRSVLDVQRHVNAADRIGLLSYVCAATLTGYNACDKFAVAIGLHDRLLALTYWSSGESANLCGIIRALVPYDEILKIADPSGNPEE